MQCRISLRIAWLTLGFVSALTAPSLGETPPPDPTPEAAPGTAPTGGDGPLDLGTVRSSVLRSYPLLVAAVAERVVAEGKLESARGGFDLRLGAEGKLKPQAFYENYNGDVTVEQPTRFWGTTLFSGYRIGRGDYPVYDGDLETYEGGEYRFGVKVPLLRGGAVDSRRTKLAQAELDRQIVEPSVGRQVLDLLRQAERSYWNWVAAGQKRAIAVNLLKTAERRNAGIARRVEKGAAPRIDLTDNERLIVDRRGKLIGAERSLQASGIDLSLYLRDEGGTPRIPSAEVLPAGFPEPTLPDPTRLDQDVSRALARHPELKRLDLQAERVQTELRLARNELFPGLDVSVAGSQDVGEPTDKRDKGPFEVEAKVLFELPLQRREAHGRVQSLQAQLGQIESQRRFARDSIIARIQDGMSALQAGFDQLAQARENSALARELERGERRKFTLGTSNLINVNIRELQSAEAAALEVEAGAEYFKAEADYRAAVADEVSLPAVSD